MERRNRRNWMALLAALVVWLGTPVAGAADGPDVKMYTDGPPSAEEMAGTLFPETRPRTRAIVLNDEPVVPQAIGFVVNFAFDSAEVLPDSRPYLDEVGRMMSLESVTDKRLRIEGHTDATGSDEYNLRLSQRRALAVANYLVQTHGIDPDRLDIRAAGEAEPLPDRDPADPLNRRVQFAPAN